MIKTSPQPLPVLHELQRSVSALIEQSKINQAMRRTELESVLSEVARHQAVNPMLAYSQMAVLHALLNQPKEVMRCLHNVEARTPVDVMVLTNCGLTCRLLGEYEREVKFHRKAWNLERTNLSPLKNLIGAQIVLGQWSEALELLSKVQVDEAQLEETHNLLGNALLTLEEQKLHEQLPARMSQLALSVLRNHKLHCHGDYHITSEKTNLPVFFELPVSAESDKIAELIDELAMEQAKHDWAMALIHWVDYTYTSAYCPEVTE